MPHTLNHSNGQAICCEASSLSFCCCLDHLQVAQSNVYSVGLDDMLIGGSVDGGDSPLLRVPLQGKPVDFDVTSDGAMKIVVTAKAILLIDDGELADNKETTSSSSQPCSCAISGLTTYTRYRLADLFLFLFLLLLLL